MTCHDAREFMLDADPDALRDRSGSLLGEHLAGCAACALAADVILAQYATLDYALRELAGATASGPAVRRYRRWLPALLVPLAAAAALAVFLRDTPTPTPFATVDTVPRSVVVNAGGPGGVAVMQTRDPNITIVWNF